MNGKTKQKTAELNLKNGTRGVLSITRSHKFRREGASASNFVKTSFRKIIVAAENDLAVSEYEGFIEWVLKTSAALAPAADLQRISDYPSLSDFYQIGKGDLAKTLTWIEARLRPQLENLKDFFEECRNVEIFALRGSLTEASDRAVALEHKYGASMHLLELRLAIAQLRGGVDEQKKLVSQLNAGRRGGLTGLIVYFVSMRNEPKVNLLRFRELVYERAAKFKDICFENYLKFRLLKDYPVDHSSAASILHVENNHAIYDMAFTAHQLLLALAVKGQTEGLEQHLRFFSEIIDVQKKEEAPQKNIVDLISDAANFNLIGPSYRSLLRKLEALELNFDAIRMLSFLRAAVKSTPSRKKTLSLSERYCEDLAAQMRAYSTIDKNGSFIKTSLNFSILPVSNSLLREVLLGTGQLRSNWMRSLMMQRPELDKLTDAILNAEANTALYPFRWLITLDLDQRNETFESFLQYCDQLNFEAVPFPLAVNIKLAQSFAYSQLGKYSRLAEAISHLAVDCKVLIDLLPISSNYESLAWKTVRSDVNFVALAITLEIFYQVVRGDVANSFKRYAIEELLVQTNVGVPSELSAEVCNVSLKQFHYFLDAICVQKNLDMLTPLRGSKDLDGERVKILSLLAQSDKSNAANYNTEIVSLLHKARIEQGVVLLDGSRVHVDEEPLFNKLPEILSNSWDRYLSLISIDGLSDGDIDSMIRKIAKMDEHDEIFSVPPNEADSLLFSMVNVVKDTFLNDADHGLDRYLGHRIRHNAFANQIRDALTPHNLITKRSNMTQDYLKNVFWESKLSGIDATLREEIVEAMSAFSRRFDETIDSTIQKKIRVNSAENPEGLFEIRLNRKALQIIRTMSSSGSSVHMFVQLCFQIFWLLLEPSLASARNLTAQKLKNEIGLLVNNLSKPINLMNDGDEAAELRASVMHARSDISRSLEKISNWFNKRFIDENAYQYTIEEAVNIVIEACVESHRAKLPLIERNIVGDVKVRATTLFQLSDIFWILIDNACSHSNLEQNTKIDIQVRAFYADGIIEITAINTLHADASQQQIISNVDAIRSDIAKRSYSEKVMVEGKSGLKKLAALILRNPSGTLDFEYLNDCFEVRIRMPLSSVYVIDDEGLL